MAAGSENLPDAFRLRDRARNELQRVLNMFEGRKDLVLDPDLMRPLDRIAGASFLKENGVDKIFKLDKHDRQKTLGGCNQRLYLVKPRMTVMKILADQIILEKSRGEERRYRIVMVPRKLYLCEMILEEEGVYGYCELDEFDLDLITLDTDILSLELPEFFRSFYLDGDQTWLHTVSRSLQTIQGIMGEIPNIYCLGRASKMCYELLQNLMGGEKLTHQPDYPRSEIGHLILFDREMDFVTPLCSQVTYEGLLDDIFGIHTGYIEFGPEITQKQQGTKILLSSEDEMFDAIRNRHFTTVFDFLKSRATELQTVSDKRKNFTSVGEMKDFVAKDLRKLNQSKSNLSYHIGACEQIISKKKKGDFQEYIQTEHSLLEGSGFRENLNYIEESIHKQNNLVNNLKLLCLMSLTNNGIPTRDYKSLKTQFIQSHGFEQMITFFNLQRIGLLQEQDSGTQSSRALPKMAAGMSRFTKSSSFKNLRKRLNLIPPVDVDLKSPCDMSYIFSGAYAPLSCKLVDQCLQKEGVLGMEEITRNLPGNVFADVKLKTPGKGGKMMTNTPGRAAKVVLVYFLGGCSYSEIAALRFLGKQTAIPEYFTNFEHLFGRQTRAPRINHLVSYSYIVQAELAPTAIRDLVIKWFRGHFLGYRFIIATTSILTGSRLLETIMETPQV